MNDLHRSQCLAAGARAGLLDPSSVNLRHHSVSAYKTTKKCDFQIWNNCAAAHHHAFDAQQMVDILKK